MSISPRSINDMSDRAYHHHDSSKAASTFMLDQPPTDDHQVTPNVHYVQDQIMVGGGVGSTCENQDEQQHSALPTKKKRDRPYLILDIRDPEEYKRGRIVTSKSYPFPRLCRSVNYETKDMLKFKNTEGTKEIYWVKIWFYSGTLYAFCR